MANIQCLFPKFSRKEWANIYKVAEHYSSLALDALEDHKSYTKECKVLPHLPPIEVTWSTKHTDPVFIFPPGSRKEMSLLIGVKKYDWTVKQFAALLLHETIHYGQHMAAPRKFAKLNASKGPYLINPLELEANALEYSYLYGDKDAYAYEFVKNTFPSWVKIAAYHGLPFAQSVSRDAPNAYKVER